MMTLGRGLAFALAGLMLLSIVPVQAQSTPSPTVTISTHWLSSTSNDVEHAYLLTFSDNGSYAITVELVHQREGDVLSYDSTIEWGNADGQRTALVRFNTSLQWGDLVSVRVHVSEHNGEAVDLTQERSLEVGQWNQPMDDHEVLMATSWSMDQAYTTSDGEQRFALTFTGQGWQERTGLVLRSYELGNGTFSTLETTPDGHTDLDLVLTHVWKNETVVGGLLTSQVFDARGHGALETSLNDGATSTMIYANVSQAELNRSIVDGVVGERLKLEATGTLDVTESGEDNASLDIDGELAVFFFEYSDVDGVRFLEHTQFEAMADFVLIEDGTRLDVSLDGFTSLARWENGVRTQHLEELYGDGTFGFADQDENASLQVNGTILDLHTKVVNGTTVIDDLHVDGTLTGDVQGTFGVLRGIETTGMQANASEVEFLVNVIFQESWFNITGVNGGNFFDGAGVGATHNQTWDYQVVNADWENRTVRMVWRETGPDASEGDERPENSPFQRNATAPQAEESLGNLTVGRETGLMPIPLQTMDRLRLNDQEGITLTVTAGAPSVDTRDGHVLTVTQWVGVYGGEGESGNASGSIVSVGPLKGLLSNVQRQLLVPFGEENETVELSELQVLERVLSPSIVSELNNTAPVVLDLRLREGIILGEGGSLAHLEATVIDAEWNVVSVEVDLSSVGAPSLVLNDRGINGDDAVGDDVYTSEFRVPGLEVGDINLTATAIDSFGRTTTFNSTVKVVNLAPRLTSVEIVPTSLQRGQSIVINVEAYDGHGVDGISMDLREYGGEQVNLTLNDGVWAAMVTMPSGMTPGEQSLMLVATDALGASQAYRTFAAPVGAVGDEVRGPHHIVAGEPTPVVVRILNDRPTIDVAPATVQRSTDEAVVYTVSVSDPDGIERVQINLGVYAPVGTTTWVMMHDDGVNGGDDLAGDGIFSVLLSIRDGTPLGTHEVSLRAFDTYGELNQTVSAVTLEAASTSGGTAQGWSSSAVVMLGAALVLAAVVVVSMMWRRGGGGGQGPTDRFGMQ